MAVIHAPEIEHPDAPPTETLPLRRRGGWSIQPRPCIGLDLGSDDELLMVENRTEVRWLVYHNFHQLGIVDPGELLVFHIHKHGSLSARPVAEGDEVEYLVLPLNYDVTYVHIFHRQMSKDIEVYDMHVA